MQYKNIKLLREEKGVSQSQIASQLKISQRAYSHYEVGDRDLPSSVIIALANYFDVSADYLLGLTDKK